MSWISEIGFEVQTEDAKYAGTNSLLTIEVLRDGNHIWTGRLDYDDRDDNDRGENEFYGYKIKGLYFDKTKPLPNNIVQDPMPYPFDGIEYSSELKGHFLCRLRIHGNDMWIKDYVILFVKYIKLKSTSFDTLDWKQDEEWSSLARWEQDINLSTDSNEGTITWSMNY